jgi:hypothetical protein
MVPVRSKVRCALFTKKMFTEPLVRDVRVGVELPSSPTHRLQNSPRQSLIGHRRRKERRGLCFYDDLATLVS